MTHDPETLINAAGTALEVADRIRESWNDSGDIADANAVLALSDAARIFTERAQLALLAERM